MKAGLQQDSDKEEIDAIDYKLEGKLSTVLMGVVSRHVAGQDGLDSSTLELIRAKLPEADPAAVEATLSNYIERGNTAACAFVGKQTGLTGW